MAISIVTGATPISITTDRFSVAKIITAATPIMITTALS